MVKARDKIREIVVHSTREYPLDYDENKEIRIRYNEKEMILTLGKINAMRTYLLRTYYPDEHVTIIALSNINPKVKKFNPKTPVPGSFYIYSCGVWLAIANSLKTIKLISDTGFYLMHPTEIKKIYLSIRILLVFTTLFSVYLLWKICSEFWGKEIACISSFLLGISPALNLWNHFGYYYGFAIPWILLTFLFSLKILQKNILKYYIFAGISIGLAMSVFLPYLLTCSFIFWILCIKFIQKQTNLSKNFKYFIITMLMTGIVFLTFHIFFLLDKEILSATIQQGAGDFIFSFQPLYFFFASLKSGLGWPFLITAIGGYILLLFKERDTKETFLLLSLIVPLLVFSSFSPWYIRRSIFLIPFMSLLSAILLDYIRKKNKIIGILLIFLVLSYTLLYSASYTKIFMEKNIRDEAGEWINNNIPIGTSIGLLQMPAPYRTPPFQFYRYNLIPIFWDKQQIEKEKPEYFIITEYEMLWETEEKIEDFFSGYYIIKYFKKPASIFGITFNRTKFSAKDFWPANPEIIIYRRKYVEE